MTWRCLRRVLGRLGGVLGRLVASWKCLGASEDRNHCFLKVKNLKILIFEGFSEVLGGGVGWVTAKPGAGFRSLKEVQCTV